LQWQCEMSRGHIRGCYREVCNVAVDCKIEPSQTKTRYSNSSQLKKWSTDSTQAILTTTHKLKASVATKTTSKKIKK